MKDTPPPDHPSRPVLMQGTVGIRGAIRGGITSISLPALLMPKKQISPQRRTRGETNCSPRMVSSPSLIPPSAGQLYLRLSLLLCLCVSLSQGSASVPPRRLPRTFIRETALLIKELIFSLLSLISIVNLKHCEFFKFSSLLSKREREKKKRWEWGDI